MFQLNRRVTPSKKKKKRRTITITLPNRDDSKALVQWTEEKAKQNLESVAYKIYHVYTTTRILAKVTKEKYVSNEVDKQMGILEYLTELLKGVFGVWDNTIQRIHGFCDHWLQFNISEEFRDMLLRGESYMEDIEETTQGLISAKSSWQIGFAFSKWFLAVLRAVVFCIAELIHFVLLFIVSLADFILDLAIDPQRRKECRDAFVSFVRWLYTHYFVSSSVLTKAVFSTLFTIAPHMLAYLTRPYGYFLQMTAWIIKKLIQTLLKHENDKGTPSPVQYSAKFIRSVIQRFRRASFALWKPLLRSVVLQTDSMQPSKL